MHSVSPSGESARRERALSGEKCIAQRAKKKDFPPGVNVKADMEGSANWAEMTEGFHLEVTHDLLDLDTCKTRGSEPLGKTHAA